MRTIVAITILAGLILVLSVVPGHSHGVNWGVSINLGVPVYAPAYPIYPAYVYYPPPPVYPVYRGGFVAPEYYYQGRHPRPYHHRSHYQHPRYR